ncbi:unnamed protein product [Caenorhabditis nigoni]
MSSQSTSSSSSGKSDGNKRKIEVIEVVGTASPPAARLQIASSSGSVLPKQLSSQEASEVKRMKIEVTDTLEAAPSPTPSIIYDGIGFGPIIHQEIKSFKIENEELGNLPPTRFMLVHAISDKPQFAKLLIQNLATLGLTPKDVRHMERFFEGNRGLYIYYFNIDADEETEEGRALIRKMERYLYRLQNWMECFHLNNMKHFRTFFSRALSPNEMIRAMVIASGYRRPQPQLDLHESINDKEMVEKSMKLVKRKHGDWTSLDKKGLQILKDVEEGKYN